MSDAAAPARLLAEGHRGKSIFENRGGSTYFYGKQTA
jgi:hypothetical protein